MENIHFQIQLDIQSVIISACMKTDRKDTWHVLDREHIRDIELEKLKIVKNIIRKFGFDQLDIKAACQQACDSEMFQIVEWFLQNIDMTMLDIEIASLESLDKRKVLKSVAKHYTAKCSTIILKIVSTIWNSTDKKEELQMQEIVDTAYERKCIGLLKCIYYACNSNISMNRRTLLMLACGDDRGDQTILNIEDSLSMLNPQFGSIGMVKWILEHFQKDPLDLKSGILVSTVCKEKEVSNGVMTWILLNLPQERIPIKEVLMSCCQQRKINHVKYIFHTFDNKQLDINQALFHAYGELSSTYLTREIVEHNDIMLVNYLFKKLHDKAVSLFLVLNELLERKKYVVILYFLEEGFCKNINLRNLMKDACHHEHVRLVQWILANVEHKELDIISAFLEVCDGIKHAKRNSFKKQCVMCLSLMWHYIRD
ncbi:unnamed protein product [Mytilus coruscus]|uniref:Uncharacterized protein n=1 Tax=Mytilus coruscus TaxID=42192 RepID=A0A6J8D1J2_MYTCO|nr:unnamed protein product [Mytilus coruscus]